MANGYYGDLPCCSNLTNLNITTWKKFKGNDVILKRKNIIRNILELFGGIFLYSFKQGYKNYFQEIGVVYVS